MRAAWEHNQEKETDQGSDSRTLEELAALSDEELQEKAAEMLRNRAMEENPLLGQLNDMFSQWEAMMESYRQEELEQRPCQDGPPL